MTAIDHPQRPQLAVSAAIFRDDKVLVVRRARSPGKGFYSLPGGRVEFGESLHTALHREVDEEAAIRIDILGLAGWREVLPSASRHVVMAVVHVPGPMHEIEPAPYLRISFNVWGSVRKLPPGPTRSMTSLDSSRVLRSRPRK